MEAFSLLKNWRGGAYGDGGGLPSPSTPASSSAVVTAVSPHFTATESESDTETDEDGPFFDLEFSAATAGDDDGGDEKPHENEDIFVDAQLSETDGGSGSGEDEEGEKSSASPPDGTLTASEADPKNPASLSKSTTKFRVLMLKLKKTKQNLEKLDPKLKQKAQNQGEKKFFTVKLKVEEPKIKSLFRRDTISSASEETKSSKEMIHKYLKSVRSFSGGRAAAAAGASPPPEKEETGRSDKKVAVRNARSQKRDVPRTLGKSRSASSAPPATSQRRDDSLKEQHDGIQGAILHCKRSFNSHTGSSR
ncbi:unnamed protein product [Cuscuta campestris]|uniref:Membrane-associated kinase regulator 2 n=1 Tax=Cuscuta campestris TaxID=132261 RepID=A0A484KXB8_9ASTE|nr:unnamed protein product [Cuscuta campestris]